MTLALAPTLNIDITISSSCEITFRWGEKPEPVLKLVNSDFSREKLSRLRAQLRAGLTEFRKRLGGKAKVEVTQGVAALRELHETGRLMLIDLFGENVRWQLPEAIRLCREACPGWEMPGWCPGGLPPMIVMTTAVGDGIPVNMLPLLKFDPTFTPEKYDLDLLGGLASSFIGFSAIVKRELGKGSPRSLRIENIPRLPIKMFIHRGLAGARREEVYLSNSDHIDLEGSWPDDNAPAEQAAFSRALASYLWEPAMGFSGKRRDPADQLCHFSCHCDTRQKRLPSNYQLSLQSGRLFRNQRVRLGSLTTELVQLGMRNRGDERPRPLVFLNACGSGDLDPAGAGSFPELFLKRGLDFIGFIGTETTIPDEFAAAFSETFYDHLLAGFSIGEALHAVRWKLLASLRNPLGILYSLYAEPEIRVRRPVAALEQALRHGVAPMSPNVG
jgi:hypothetical protein